MGRDGEDRKDLIKIRPHDKDKKDRINPMSPSIYSTWVEIDTNTNPLKFPHCSPSSFAVARKD